MYHFFSSLSLLSLSLSLSLLSLPLSRSLSLSLYIYIYINTNFVKHNRHFLATYFLVDAFTLPYCLYRIRRELIDVFSIIVYIPSIYCPTLGHHQRRIYNKSHVTFVDALLLYKSVFTVGVCSVCF